MATEKDTAMGDLEACPDVFAEIMSVLMFKGTVQVREDELEQGREKSSYESEQTSRIRPQYRDIHKYWKNSEIRIAYVGFENETDPEEDMAFRAIGYDGAAYRDQIYYYTDQDGKRHKSTERYPVVTLVLYMGYKKRWDKAKSIYEANNNYKPSDIQIRHVREVLNAMTALTNDTRFREVYAVNEKGDEPKTMCEVLDRVEARGEESGRKAERMELTKLMAFLVKNGRYEDVVKAEADDAFLDQLIAEFHKK